MTDRHGLFDFFWPEIDDSATAVDAARLGLLGAVVFIIYSLGVVIYRSAHGLSGVDVWAASIEVAIFAFLAFGIWRLWRWAAVTALILFALEQIASAVAAGRMVGLILPIVLALFLVSGVRGTFNHAKFKRETEQAVPAAPDEGDTGA